MKKALQMCMNWKVLAGLAGVAVALWLVAPKAVLGVLPFVAFLVCPLSMVIMMRAMQSERPNSRAQRRGVSDPSDSQGPSLAELKGRLADMRSEEQSIAREVARLETQDDHGGVGIRTPHSPPMVREEDNVGLETSDVPNG